MASKDGEAPCVWVVEINFGDGGGWESCAACALSREDGRLLLKQWRKHDPDDVLRITKYRREERHE